MKSRAFSRSFSCCSKSLSCSLACFTIFSSAERLSSFLLTIAFNCSKVNFFTSKNSLAASTLSCSAFPPPPPSLTISSFDIFCCSISDFLNSITFARRFMRLTAAFVSNSTDCLFIVESPCSAAVSV